MFSLHPFQNAAQAGQAFEDCGEKQPVLDSFVPRYRFEQIFQDAQHRFSDFRFATSGKVLVFFRSNPASNIPRAGIINNTKLEAINIHDVSPESNGKIFYLHSKTL